MHMLYIHRYEGISKGILLGKNTTYSPWSHGGVVPRHIFCSWEEMDWGIPVTLRGLGLA